MHFVYQNPLIPPWTAVGITGYLKGPPNTIQVDHCLIAGRLAIADRFDPCAALVAPFVEVYLRLQSERSPLSQSASLRARRETSGALDRSALCARINAEPDLTCQPEMGARCCHEKATLWDPDKPIPTAPGIL